MDVTSTVTTDLGAGASAPPERRADVTFEEFVRASGPRMHRTALLLTGGDHHLAEDLTQATYTKVYAAWRRVSRADDPVAYTRTVLTRTFLSHRRLRRSSERPQDVLPDSAGPASPPGDPALRLDLLAALGRLPARDRTVLVLRYWQDLSVAETAETLRLSQAAVRQQSRRALARLRDLVPELDPATDTDSDTDPTTGTDSDSEHDREETR